MTVTRELNNGAEMFQRDPAVGLRCTGVLEKVQVNLPTVGSRPGIWMPLPCDVSSRCHLGDRGRPYLIQSWTGH